MEIGDFVNVEASSEELDLLAQSNKKVKTHGGGGVPKGILSQHRDA